MIEFIFTAGIIAAIGVVYAILRTRHINIWLPHYLARKFQSSSHTGPKHIMFCFVDHFEPYWHKPTEEVAEERVDRWCEGYPQLAAEFTDADGRFPSHSFFYPAEEYRADLMDKITAMCADGFGEVEIHLHHHDDTEENFNQEMIKFVNCLHERHGLIGATADGDLKWGFIHGNWTLDNSHPSGKMCGINNELTLLDQLGCYADFTMPSAPSPTQTRIVNSIYYADDNPDKPKSHDWGVRVEVGSQPSGDLMIIQGPLGFDWSSKKFGLIPKIENGDIRAVQPPTRNRIRNWIAQNVCVKGKPEWVFVKIHTHGTQEPDMPTLLGEPVREMFRTLNEEFNDGENFVLHYTSAREMYNIVKAAEAGEEGNPNDYRDYIVKPPLYLRSNAQRETETSTARQ